MSEVDLEDRNEMAGRATAVAGSLAAASSVTIGVLSGPHEPVFAPPVGLVLGFCAPVLVLSAMRRRHGRPDVQTLSAAAA